MIPFPLPSFVPRYVPREASSEWSGHLAFGHDLVTEVRPSLYVAIGVSSGDAYFGVCQTILEKGLDCRCYGVLACPDDVAASDAEAWELYNANHYQSFSYLLNCADQPARNFSEGTVDIVHISDSRAASQLLEQWLPKVKPGGFVLVGQIARRDAEADAWRVWEQMERTFEESFAFQHADGLGILRKPGGEPLASSFLQALFSGSAEVREYIRRHYAIYNGYLDSLLRSDYAAGALSHKIDELTTELRATQHERMILEAELTHKQLELTRMQIDRKTAERTIAGLQESLSAAESAHEATRAEKQQLAEALQIAQQAKQKLVRSLSWRMTAPMRDFMEWKRKRKAD